MSTDVGHVNLSNLTSRLVVDQVDCHVTGDKSLITGDFCHPSRATGRQEIVDTRRFFVETLTARRVEKSPRIEGFPACRVCLWSFARRVSLVKWEVLRGKVFREVESRCSAITCLSGQNEGRRKIDEVDLESRHRLFDFFRDRGFRKSRLWTQRRACRAFLSPEWGIHYPPWATNKFVNFIITKITTKNRRNCDFWT